MRTFRDMNGTERNVSFTVGTFRKIKKELKLDLLSMNEKELTDLMGDIISSVDILYIACETDLSAEDFAETLGGDSCEDGIFSMFEALADFFPRARRMTIHSIIKKTKALLTEAYTEATEKIDAIQLGDLSTEPQASSDTTATATR